jgi:hypothetical protein
MAREDVEKPYAVENAHNSWLKEVVSLLYLHNRNAEAQKWFDYLRTKYPHAVPKDVISAEEFAFKRIQDNLSTMSHDRTIAAIEGFIAQHFLNLAVDEDDRAAGLDRLALKVWTDYDIRIANRREVLELRPYAEMKRTVVEQLLSGLLPELAARLRTKLGLPASAGTNAPPKTGP